MQGVCGGVWGVWGGGGHWGPQLQWTSFGGAQLQKVEKPCSSES